MKTIVHHAALLMLGLAASALCSSCNPVKSSKAAKDGVAQFHDQLNKGEFPAIYAATHPDFKAATTEKDFTAILSAVHRKLGVVQSSQQKGININSFNLKTNVTLTHETEFAEGKGIETFVFRVSGDGDRATLLGYNINSQELITK